MQLAVEMIAVVNHLAEHLTDQEKFIVLEVMKRFLPDHIATEEDLQDIRIAREQLAKGEVFSHDEINWD